MDWIFPLTLSYDWCGEFQPVKAEVAPKTPIKYAVLTVRTRNCLLNEDFHCVEDALERADQELLKIPNFSKRCLVELRQWANQNQPPSKSTT